MISLWTQINTVVPEGEGSPHRVSVDTSDTQTGLTLMYALVYAQRH